jgi:peptide deformylase
MTTHDHAHDDPPEHDDVELIDDEEEAQAAAEREALKRVALSQIRQYGDPALRMRAEEVDMFDQELWRLSERMIGLMHDADGIGLAANQVGILRRFFVFNDGEADRVLVNPVVAKASSKTEVDEEGCLSLGPVRMDVERPIEVTIQGKDAAGADVSFSLEGLIARVVQHEIDHLDGVLILDRTDPESRREALRQLRPRLLLAT